jgi:hypothetical protein
MSKKVYRQNVDHWYLERIIFLIAGILVSFSVALSFIGYSGFQYFALFVGIMLINFSVSGYCPLAIIVSKLGINERRQY